MKNKKILKIRPNEEFADNFINIAPASEFLPEWYRNSPSKISGQPGELVQGNPSATSSTYKKCSPFLDAITSGYIVYLSADIEITKQENNMPLIQWRTQRKIVTQHDPDQWEGLPCPEGYFGFVFKWHNQHVINTPEGYSMLFVKPQNRFDLPFETISGIVDTDKYNISVHFPFFIKNSFTGIIKAGTPICQMIPIKRDSWKIQHLKYDKNLSIKNIENFKSVIKRSYKNLFWQRKEYR